MSSKQSSIINKEEFSFLPTILNIFEKINSEDMKDTQAIKKISMNLLENIEECKKNINKLPGIENSNLEQLNKYDEEIKVVNQRRKQFIHYLNMPIFKKFYHEAEIQKQNDLVSIQERLEAQDKERVKEIKRKVEEEAEGQDPNQASSTLSTENAAKKIKTEASSSKDHATVLPVTENPTEPSVTTSTTLKDPDIVMSEATATHETTTTTNTSS